MPHQFHEDKIEKIEKVSSADSKATQNELYEPEQRLAPNKDRFDALMASPVVPSEDVRKVSTNKNSIVEEVANVEKLVDQARRGKPQDLIAQAQEAIGKIKELKQTLTTPDLQIQGSIRNELRNKLSHIDDNLRIALSKSGLEYTPPPEATKAQTPIERFLGLLTDSQTKLDTLTQDISRLDKLGVQMSPATLLVLQMKVGMVQQEVEFFSGLLNKALESTKTIMNVQV